MSERDALQTAQAAAEASKEYADAAACMPAAGRPLLVFLEEHRNCLVKSALEVAAPILAARAKAAEDAKAASEGRAKAKAGAA